MSPVEVLLMAVWFGLLTGLLEVAGLGVVKFVLGHYIHQVVDVVWMAPLAALAVMAGPAFGLALVARLRPGLVTVPLVTFVFAWIGFTSLLFLETRLAKLAAFVLAAGLAAQAGRLAGSRPSAFRAIVRRTTPWLVLLVVASAAATQGGRALIERRTLNRLPPPAAGAPNVLLLVLDTVRAQSLSLYDQAPAPANSPNLERLARRGTVFERAVATAPWTLPSHASLFTGRYAHEHEASYQSPLDDASPTLAEELSEQGYVTAGFVGNTYYCSRESGLQRGFAHYEDFPISPRELVHTSALLRRLVRDERLRRLLGNRPLFGRKLAADVNRDVLDWLRGRREPSRPFFVFVNYFDAHAPYMPPAPFDVRFGVPPPRERPGMFLPEGREWTAAEIRQEQKAYRGAIAYLDHHVGRLLEELERRGELHRTVVVVTSDHGEEFGEHRVMGHGNSLYRPSLHVPLLIAFPGGVPAGRRVPEPVTLRDVPATILALTSGSADRRIPGSPLTRFWDPARAGRAMEEEPLLSEVRYAQNLPEWYPVSKGDLRSLVAGRYHYIHGRGGTEELYDVVADPWERHDLARERGGRSVATRLRRELQDAFSDGRRDGQRPPAGAGSYGETVITPASGIEALRRSPEPSVTVPASSVPSSVAKVTW